MKKHRYGTLVVITPTGKWYWDDILEMLAFVPKGMQRATKEHVLRSARSNKLPSVLITIAEIELGKREPTHTS